MEKISKNQIALAGEFAVLSQLALHGFDANLTLGNTKGVDILVSNPKTGSMKRLEVKTHTHNKPYNNTEIGCVVAQWRMSDKHEGMRDPNLFYCFVSISEHYHFEFYVVPSYIVADFVTDSHKHWLGNLKRQRRDNPMRAFQLGSKDYEYDFKLPFAEDYKRKWELLK